MNSCPNPTDLLTKPTNRILSMNINGQNITDINSLSPSSTGVSAKSGNNLESWIIDTKLIDSVTSIGLTNSLNVVGPIKYKLYDSFNKETTANGDSVGQIVPVNADLIQRIVISAPSQTINDSIPTNMKLHLYGCYKEDQFLDIIPPEKGK